MDGTLLDLSYDNYIWRQHVPRVYARANGVEPATAIDAILGKYRAVQGTLEWYCLDHWRERLGVDVVQIHHDLKHRIRYLPGALDFLRAMQASDKSVLLVTNSHPDTLALKDAVTGLGDYLDGMHSSHDYGHAKESLPFWKALQSRLGFDPATTLFIDDSTDVLANARDFGIGLLLAVAQPDSTLPPADVGDFVSVAGVADLIA